MNLTKEELLKLVNAGFTKEEILGSSTTNDESNDASNDESNDDASNGESNEGASNDESNKPGSTNVDAFQNTFNEMMAQMTKQMESFKNDIKSMNSKKDSMGDVESDDLDSILGRAILPPKLK